jgi:hypothetical protein
MSKNKSKFSDDQLIEIQKDIESKSGQYEYITKED